MFVLCSCGHRHWGRYGAAGLVLTDPARTGVLLQKRSRHVHRGGTWSVPGGAIEPGEAPVDAALREAEEEAGIRADQVTVSRTFTGTDHGTWRYTYVLAEADRPARDLLRSAGSTSWEADRTTWVDLDAVASYRLHPGLREAWAGLREELVQP